MGAHRGGRPPQKPAKSKSGENATRKIEKRENSCYFAAFALTPLKASVRRDL